MVENAFPTLIYLFDERWQQHHRIPTPIKLSSAAPVEFQSTRLHYSASACLEYTVGLEGKGYYKSSKNRWSASDDVCDNPLTQMIRSIINVDATVVWQAGAKNRLAITGRGLRFLKLAFAG